MDRDQGCTDDTANATLFVLWIRLKFVVLSMELASCHASSDDILGWLLYFGEICAPLVGTVSSVEMLPVTAHRTGRL